MENAKINLVNISSQKELHMTIARALNFPDYYGQNWDAFDECISDPELVKPKQVVISGLGYLQETLPDQAKLLVACFNDAAESGYIRVQWDE